MQIVKTKVLNQKAHNFLDHLRRRVESRNGPAATLFGSGPYAGRTLAEIASTEQRPFEEVLADLGPDGASAAYFVMDEGVMEALLTSEGAMVASDGSPTMRHPRGHGTFPRVLAHHVRERGALTLEDAVHRMTGLPAALLGLGDRGTTAAGAAADLVVFDPERVQDNATFTAPFDRATGFRAVFVAGEADQAADRAIGRESEQAKQKPAQQRADHAHDQIGDEARAAPLHDLAREPPGRQTDQEKPHDVHDERLRKRAWGTSVTSTILHSDPHGKP